MDRYSSLKDALYALVISELYLFLIIVAVSFFQTGQSSFIILNYFTLGIGVCIGVVAIFLTRLLLALVNLILS